MTLAALVAIDTGELDPSWVGAVPVGVRVVLAMVGLSLGVAGLVVDAPAVSSRGAPWSRGEIVALASITTVALLVRVWHLDALRLLIDEGNSIDNLFHARGTGAPLLLPPSQYVTTLVHPYWQALVVDVAGSTLTGFRLSNALLGTATVAALYGLARALYDRRVAVVAACLLATFPPHVHFSRIGLPHIVDTLFGTLALGCLSRALRDDRRRDWALGGLALGLTHYGFEAGRLFFTPLAVLWLAVVAMLETNPPCERRRGLATAAAAFALAVVPLYSAVLVAGANVVPRWQTSQLDLGAALRSPDAASDLLQRILFAARVYVTQPELATFYGGDWALILPVLVPFFLLGFGLTLFRPRSRGVLVPIWVVAAWLANAAMRDVAVYPRWVVVLPAIAFAAALGIATVAARLRRAPTASALTITLLVGAAQLHYYFAVHIDRLSTQARAGQPHRDAYDAVLRAVAELPRETDLWFITDPVIDVHPVRSLLRLLLDGSDTMRIEARATAELAPEQLASIAQHRHVAVFVAPDDAETVTRLRAYLDLSGPRSNPFPIAADRELALYFAPASADPTPPSP